MKVINGKNIFLRAITYADADQIIKWRNKESVRKNFIYQDDFTKESQENWMKNQIEPGKSVQMIIFSKVQNRPVGSVYLRDIDWKNKKAEYGIFIGEDDARGCGYGTEAALLMLDYAFKRLGIHKVYLRVLKENIAAQRSYEKAVFEKEAEFKDDVCIKGVFKTVVFMGKISE